MQKTVQKHLDIKVTDELHRQTKTQAAMQGVTVTDYIISLIQKDLQQKETNE